MKAVPFSDILAEVCQLAGLDRLTLNDKSFFAIRDFTNRRIGTIWDREEWPDNERYIDTYPGNPISSLVTSGSVIVTNNNEAIITSDGEFLVFSDVEDITFTLATDFPRVYLADFEDDAYKKGQVGSTKLKISNGFYITKEDLTLYNTNEYEYEFTYTTLTDDIGEYIATVTIDVPLGVTGIFQTSVNGKLTPVITFLKNKNYIVKLPTTIVHGLDAWDKDPRNTSRTNQEAFIVEDNVLSDGTFLRFADAKKKFIKYRVEPPRLLGAKLQTQVYAQGSSAYYDVLQESANYFPSVTSKGSSGDFWVAKSSVSAGTFPAVGSAYWTKIEIPMRFKEYLVNGVSADFLRSEGRAEEANIFEQIAEGNIQQQIDVYIRQQGQNQRMNMVFTY